MSDTPTPIVSLDPLLSRALRSEKLAESNGILAHNAAIELTAARDELKAVTEQRDRAWQTIAEIKRDIIDDETFGNVVVKLWQEPLDEAIEQRDRLAEALKEIINLEDPYITWKQMQKAKQALQSLNQNPKDQERTASPVSECSKFNQTTQERQRDMSEEMKSERPRLTRLKRGRWLYAFSLDAETWSGCCKNLDDAIEMAFREAADEDREAGTEIYFAHGYPMPKAECDNFGLEWPWYQVDPADAITILLKS